MAQRREQQRRRPGAAVLVAGAFLPLLCLLAAGGAEALKFAAIGDWGDGSSAETSVANLVKSWSVDHVLALGDDCYSYGYAADYAQHVGRDYSTFINSTSAAEWGGFSSSADGQNHFWPIPGNHDWGSSRSLCGSYSSGCSSNCAGSLAPYLKLMPVSGQRYYTQVLGGGLVELFALDSDCNEPDGTSSSSVQATWLKTKLAASTATWKVVMLHHSPFSSGNSHGSIARLQWPFAAWGAHVVLSGHDHVYERIQQPGGIPYIVNGIGGAGRNGFIATPVSGSQVRYANNWGAVRIDVDATAMRFELYSVTPTLRDCFVISNAGGAVSYPGCDGTSPSPSPSPSPSVSPPPSLNSYSLLTGAAFVDQAAARPHLTWRYKSTNSIGSTWYTAGFNANTWARNVTRFGYGGDFGAVGGYATPLPDARLANPVLKHYFRTSFCLSAARLAWLRAQAGVVLKVAADNGCNVYLNGVSLLADAASNHDAFYWNNALTVPGTSDAFVQGTNWLAAYVSNTAGSTDAAFDLDILYQNAAPLNEAPGAPTGVAATPASRTSMKVVWTKPACDGSSFVTSYTLTASPGGVVTTVSVTDPFATAYSKTVSGLTRCTTYTFTVAARNAAGASSGVLASNKTLC